jgi:prevent-host-death family protein
MPSSRDIEPVTSLKTSPAELISRARDRRSPIVITQNGRATAVLQDIESYERQRRAFLILKLLARGEADYAGGRTLSDAGARRRLRARLRARR